jgi:hypothetical protein
MAKPLTSSPRKLAVLIQWVMRTRAECRGESRISEIRAARPERDADTARATERSYHEKPAMGIGLKILQDDDGMEDVREYRLPDGD